MELAPFQALGHPGSVNNSPAKEISWEKRLFMSISQAPLPLKPSSMILSQLSWQQNRFRSSPMFLFPQAHLWTSHITPFCQWMEKEKDSL